MLSLSKCTHLPLRYHPHIVQDGFGFDILDPKIERLLDQYAVHGWEFWFRHLDTGHVCAVTEEGCSVNYAPVLFFADRDDAFAVKMRL